MQRIISLSSLPSPADAWSTLESSGVGDDALLAMVGDWIADDQMSCHADDCFASLALADAGF